MQKSVKKRSRKQMSFKLNVENFFAYTHSSA